MLCRLCVYYTDGLGVVEEEENGFRLSADTDLKQIRLMSRELC